MAIAERTKNYDYKEEFIKEEKNYAKRVDMKSGKHEMILLRKI